MDFSLYPFDTQQCLFAMSAQNDERYMERNLDNISTLI